MRELQSPKIQLKTSLQRWTPLTFFSEIVTTFCNYLITTKLKCEAFILLDSTSDNLCRHQH